MNKILKNYYFAVYKPFGMLSQFSADEVHSTLAELFDFPKDVYPVGRLDHDSEGLLLLTNDKTLNERLLSPKNGHSRTYWIQVEGEITAEALSMLSKGVEISIDGQAYQTMPSTALSITEPKLPERFPPIRFRKNIPTSWISLTLNEGKNRQVRKMTAKVGFPTLRLVRYAIGRLTIEGMMPGDVFELDMEELFEMVLSNSMVSNG